MTHKRPRSVKRLNKKYKRLAAAVAGAALLTGAALPVIPAIVHAAAPPDAGNPPAPTTQPVGDTSMAAQTTANPNPSTNTPSDYKQKLDIVATAYAPGPHDNDQWGSKTFAGTQVRPGVVAVDPRVIPIGSRVFIQYPDGHGEYAVAEDTGGAIKGHRIDVAKWTVKEAQDFGIQQVKVFVVDSPQKG